MDISAINLTSFSTVNKRTNTTNYNNKRANQTELSQYPRPYIAKFGQKEPKEFDVTSLPNIGIDQEFSNTELIPPKGGICLTSIFDLTSHLAEQIRYYEKHGELIPYKKAQILEECKYNSMSDEETQQRIEQETQAFSDNVARIKEDAVRCLDSLSPTEKEHTVYRTISKGYSQDSNDYFNRIKELKEGEEIVLDSVPIYVSTSAQKTIGNYGGKNDNILFKINLPKGSKLLRLPSSDGIEQGIMKPDAKFKVVENKEFKNDFHLITLDYLNI